MKDKSGREANKSQKNARPKKSQAKDAWHRADQQLDDALRLTFPASDALSIV